MTAERLIKSSDFPATSVPAFWPMALAASLMKSGVELYVKNLKFVEEEIKINAELRPNLATENTVRLDLRTMVPGGHIGLFMGSRTLREAWPAIARWICDSQVSPDGSHTA
jgi:hypothetical protein